MMAPTVDDSNVTWSLWHGPNKLSSPHRKALYEIIWAGKMKTYWSSEHEQGSKVSRVIPPRIPPCIFRFAAKMGIKYAHAASTPAKKPNAHSANAPSLFLTKSPFYQKSPLRKVFSFLMTLVVEN